MSSETNKTNDYVYDMLLFMKQDADENPDIKDAIEVIMDCVEGAYNIYPDYRKDISGRNASDLAKIVKGQHLLVQPAFSKENKAVTATDVSKLIDENKKNIDKKYCNAGHLFYSKNQYKEAVSEYNKAIEISPLCYMYYVCRASAHYHDGNYKSCILDCQEALNLNPSCSKVYGRLGIAYYRLGDLENAQAALIQASDLDPECAIFQWILAMVDKQLSTKGPLHNLLDDVELAETLQIFEDTISSGYINFSEAYDTKPPAFDNWVDTYDYSNKHPPSPEESNLI